jgi:probable rRNA maturation factor
MIESLQPSVNDQPSSVALVVDVQFAVASHAATKECELPNADMISQWATAAHQYLRTAAKNTAVTHQNEITVRIVGDEEMMQLNHQFRGKDGLTNVLSFAFELEQGHEYETGLLGDIVLCHTVVVEESQTQKKHLDHHYAHLVVHGLLHLCGYDHQEHSDAQIMEALEVDILASINISNPYF